ncbi:RIOK1, RIO kinase 1 [Babesia microti strain RI]|uniref:Serine/threonine-protein kinase RIO1 n=1 Tax=Babesia microti (strain RI) TaxID=1133968 RepID=A0A0K3AT82_BABMR|nr:RIOK1, RIO kinase 1 [Babesia microti strain RI]CTQ40771.1 RIOK1, RIO kinase 1 [Babesia microti strain RI]|eukprot:XP_012648782.1 RIOK1, RIO kinase 1 [Babesia microti strain RI]
MDSSSDSTDSNIDTSFVNFRKLTIKNYNHANDTTYESFGGATADELSLRSTYWRKNEKGITKESRATVQQVLDRRTLYRLSKLASIGAFIRLFGVISTGKEANIYEAMGNNGTRLVVKVYKTSILIFKDRSKYIQGEFRFRRGYMSNKNPRKMVKQWAEKEYRNLRRIIISGIRCPSPVALKDHVLVMQQITYGDIGVAARLHDYKYVNQYIYAQVICIMRYMYQKCRLIHGDLSEYNLLVGDNDLVYVIDVSQAIEHDHAEAMTFLRRDCVNVNNFFRRQPQVNILSNRLLFHFITEDEDSALINKLHNTISGGPSSKMDNMNDFDDVDLVEISKNDSDELISIGATVELLGFYNKVRKYQCRSISNETDELSDKITRNRKIFDDLVQKFLNWQKPESKYYDSDDLEGLMLPTQFAELSADMVESMQLSDPVGDQFDVNMIYEVAGNETVDETSDKTIKPVSEMFTGVIPPHIDRKEWKKMVKELHRQQRMVKIPKHIKRKK